MVTLAEITVSSEALKKAAKDFVAFHYTIQSKPGEDNTPNHVINTEKEFIELMNKCGTDKTIDYKKLVEI